MNNCTLLWRKADLEVKKFKNTAPPEHFWELRCSKSVRCCGAKHMWKSKCKGTPDSEHFWKLRCSPRCGAKRVSKSKCRKRCSSGAHLEVEMLKKCTPLWREARFQVRVVKAPHVRADFGGCDVECTPLRHEAHLGSKHVKNTPRSDFWMFNRTTRRYTTTSYNSATTVTTTTTTTTTTTATTAAATATTCDNHSHNGACFLNISTSKSASRIACF